VARSFLQLANGFIDRGYRVELVLCRAVGPYLADINPAIEVVELEPESGVRARIRALFLSPGAVGALLLPVLLARKPPPVLPYMFSLARHLEEARPDVLLAGKTHTNMLAIWGNRLASNSTRVVISERTSLSMEIRSAKKWRWRHVAALVGTLYPLADAITSVSEGVSDDLAETAGLARETITTIYNPVARPEIYEKANLQPDHPYFNAGGPPVVVAAGRLTEQKQFPVLLDAFARVRMQTDARLLILGEGRDRSSLQVKIQQLGLEPFVSMPGFSDNPYAHMAKAAVFVLSSAWEGLPGVLIEALVCGCPVVSCDCPSGPREILAGGKFGELVPVGDVDGLARAILTVLENPPDRQPLRSRGAEFSLEASVEKYLAALFPES
jgi:glycosyltransferase involved in cell wall biosynthesis